GEFTPDQLIELLADYPASENGRAYEYSTLPYTLLGLVLDAIDDDQLEPGGWKAVVKASVLEPLNMDEVTSLRSNIETNRIAMPHMLDGKGRFVRTRLAKTDANLHAAGGHFASARALARFVAMHLGGGTFSGHRIFDADVIASTHREQTLQQNTVLTYQRDGWGYGWDRALWRDERILQRFGSFRSYFSHMSFLPEHNLGVVVLANGTTPTPAADLMARLIYDRLMEREDLDTRFAEALTEAVAERDHHAGRIAADLDNRSSRLAPLPQPLEAYSGSFHNDAMGTMHWQAIAGGLEVSMGIAHARAEIFDANKNLLRITLSGGGTVAGFEFNDAGNATRVRWNGFDFLPVAATSD
ncbi:MAG: serine hydrolase domain-containing protein, partial [Pseudomonadota bacterium]